MTTETQQDRDRRRHARFAGGDYPLRVGRFPARLVNWSAGGVGVVLRDGTAGLQPGEAVTLGIPCDRTAAVAVFPGRVQHVDVSRGLVGVAFTADAEDAIRLLAEFLHDGGCDSGQRPG
ncbi:PilZ domain-containing protein [Azospirillum thermophilum]|nr:PilZ domain-containing protein [Azospirillum thermophilum]